MNLNNTKISFFNINQVKLFPQFSDGSVPFTVLLHYLSNGHLEMFLGHVHPSFSQRVHSCFGAGSLHFSTRRATHLLSYLPKVDATREVHLAGVDAQDVQASLFIGGGKFNFPVNSSGSEESRIQNINTIRRHDHLNVLMSLKTVELVQKFQHRPLNFGITTSGTSFQSGRTNRVDFVHENNGGRMLSRHNEQFTNHPRTFTDKLLHQFRSGYPDESTLGVMGDCPGEQSLTGTWWPVQEHTLGLSDTQSFEQFRVLHWKLDHFLDLLDLLIKTSDHLVG